MQVTDNAAWVEANFGSSGIGDKRLDERLLTLASNALKAPHGSIPTQNVDWAESKAAYRFYDNAKVTFDKVAGQHWDQTRQTKPGRYLLICDTTEIEHTKHKVTTGLGPLGNGSSRGMQLHSCLMYHSGSDQIVGIGGAVIHYRQSVPEGETEMQRLNRLRESHVWGTLADQVGAAPEGSQWVHVWDRGGDDFESLCHVVIAKNHFIVRAGRLNRKIVTSDGQSMELKQALGQAEVLGSYDVEIRTRNTDAARTATMEVSVLKVTYPPPRNRSNWVKNCGVEAISVNVVIARELNPPKGSTRIMWVLLTTLPVDSLEDAMQIIWDYEKRWLIEEYHKVIKSGCSVQQHALRTADRLERITGLLSVIGTRILQLKLIGRNQPKAQAKTHVPASWLEALQLYRPKLKTASMTVYQFVREIAKIGGFLGRKGDGEPGWITIWRGIEKLLLVLDGIILGRTTKAL